MRYIKVRCYEYDAMLDFVSTCPFSIVFPLILWYTPARWHQKLKWTFMFSDWNQGKMREIFMTNPCRCGAIATHWESIVNWDLLRRMTEVNEDFLLIVRERKRDRGGEGSRMDERLNIMNSGGAFFLCYISFTPYDILVPITLMSPRASKSRQEGNEILRFYSERKYWNGKTNHHRILGGIQKIFVLEIFAIWLFIQTIIIVRCRCRCEGWCERALEDVDGVRFCCPRVHIYTHSSESKWKLTRVALSLDALSSCCNQLWKETTLLFKYKIKFLCNSLLLIVCFPLFSTLFFYHLRSLLFISIWMFEHFSLTRGKWPSTKRILADASESWRSYTRSEI